MIIVMILTLLTSFVYADTNGVWHLVEDVRPGVFGSNEHADFTNNYTFINKVYFLANSIFNLTDSSYNGSAVMAIVNGSDDIAINGIVTSGNSYSGYFEGGRFVADTNRFGIGISNPRTVLDVKSDESILQLDTNAIDQDSGIRLMEDTVIKWEIYNDGNSDDMLRIAHNAGGEDLVIRQNGWIGINTMNPSVRLDVNGAIRANNIYTSSNVGIGTVSPSAAYMLDVNGDIHASNIDVDGTLDVSVIDANIVNANTFNGGDFIGDNLNVNTVTANNYNGIVWSDIANKPAGFDDNVDNVGSISINNCRNVGHAQDNWVNCGAGEIMTGVKVDGAGCGGDCVWIWAQCCRVTVN